MGQSFTPGLRPFLPSDAPLLADIYREAIQVLAEDDYDPAQREAWAARADDEQGFATLLAGDLTLVAVVGGTPVGFACMRGKDHVEMLYVHPSAAEQGLGGMLLGALVKLATARGATVLTADVSDVATHLFEKHGFEAQRRETIDLDGIWLARTSMRKQLAAAGQNNDNAPGGRQ